MEVNPLPILISEGEIRYLFSERVASRSKGGKRVGFRLSVIADDNPFQPGFVACHYQCCRDRLARFENAEGPLILDAIVHGHGRHVARNRFVGQRHRAVALVHRNHFPTQIKSLLRQGGLRFACSQNEEQA